ncbi:MAG: hypothetical protein ACKV2V_08830 [Blastocatellia bacterium]
MRTSDSRKQRGKLISYLLSLALVLQPLAISTLWPAGAMAQQSIDTVQAIISTVAGGGLSGYAPARQASMVQPNAVVLDPQGRGFYVVDNVGGRSLLRFVNTGAGPIQLGGITIAAGQLGHLAGGNIPRGNGETAVDADLGQISGIAVNPAGTLVYVLLPTTSEIRAINAGAVPAAVGNLNLAPGAIATAFETGLIADPRVLALQQSTGDLFFIGQDGASEQSVVFRVVANGTPVIHAGGGVPATGNGDGGQATAARLTLPTGLALTATGDLLITEGGNVRSGATGTIRSVTPGGIISTLTPLLDFPVGVTAVPGGGIVVATGNGQQVMTSAKAVIAGKIARQSCDQTLNPTCGDGGAAAEAAMSFPGSSDTALLTLAADQAGIYIPDFRYRRVRYINTSGGAVTIAGKTIQPGAIDTIAGSGLENPYDGTDANNAELNSPTSAVEDASGNLYISDTLNNRLRFVNRGQNTVTLFPGTGWATQVPAGQIVTLNSQAGQTRADDRVTTSVFDKPMGLFPTANGLYIVDSQYGAVIRPVGSLTGRRSGHIRFLNTSGQGVTIYPGGGTSAITVPPGMIRDIAGINVQAGSDSGDGGAATQAFLFPTDLAVNAAGDIFIADQGNQRIRRINGQTGVISSVQHIPAGQQNATALVTGNATGIDLDAGGRLYIADTQNHRVLAQNAANANVFDVLTQGSVNATLSNITNADANLIAPSDVTVDGDGNVFVTSAGTHQILQICPAMPVGSRVTVMAGTIRGMLGDGGPASLARLDMANLAEFKTSGIVFFAGLRALANGDFLLADIGNGRIRYLQRVVIPPPAIATIASQQVNENQTKNVDFDISYAGTGTLTLSLENAPAFVTLQKTGDKSGRLILAPGYSDSGNHSATIKVTDGRKLRGNDMKTVSITVTDVNRPPTAQADIIASPVEAKPDGNATVALKGSGSDPDGDTLSYRWFDGAAQIANTAQASVELGVGQHAIFLEVMDNRGGKTSTAAQQVTVTPSTQIPAFYTINGKLTNLLGRAVAGARVEISGGAAQTKTTDANGGFIFTNMPGGQNYRVRVLTPTARVGNTNFYVNPGWYDIKPLTGDRYLSYVYNLTSPWVPPDDNPTPTPTPTPAPTPTPTPTGEDASLLNPSFENGFTDWMQNGLMSIERNRALITDGVAAARLQAINPFKGSTLTQFVRLAPGATYEVSVDVETDGKSRGSLGVILGETEQTVFTPATSARRSRLTLQFTMPAGLTQAGIYVRATGSAGQWLIADNFRLVRIP